MSDSFLDLKTDIVLPCSICMVKTKMTNREKEEVSGARCYHLAPAGFGHRPLESKHTGNK